jgi:hypothetical protein
MDKKKYLFITNQGFTDIFILLPILKYYSLKCIHICLVIRKESEEFINYFIKDINLIDVLYLDRDYIITLRNSCWENKIDVFIKNHKILNFFKEKNLIIEEYYKMYIGQHDNCLSYNLESFNILFSKYNGNWVKAFYHSKKLDYNIRKNYFKFERNYELENITYENFIKEFGEDYNLSHSVNNNIIKKYNSYNTILLNNKTFLFFDYIKILINSKNIFVVDSVWCIFIYLLDLNYQLFSNKIIYFYPSKYNAKFFINEPLLDNWRIIE